MRKKRQRSSGLRIPQHSALISSEPIFADAADEPTKVSADAVRRASAFSSAAACHKDWYLCFGDVSHPAGNLESNVDNVIACETSKLNALASGVKRNECDFKRTEAMLCSSCWS